MSKSFDKTVVSCPRGYELLYADFCSEFRPHDFKGVKDCWRSSVDGSEEMKRFRREMLDLPGTHIRPSHFPLLIEQDFIRYGDRGHAVKADVVVHARGLFGRRPEDSWPAENWDTLCRRLDAHGFKVAAVGTDEEAFCPNGVALPMLDATLQDVCNVMAASRLVIGPSSGPLVLASLCGTPHLVWGSERRWTASRNETVRSKFERVWNPLGTPCRVVDEYGWRPPPDKVYREVLECLASLQPLL